VAVALRSSSIRGVSDTQGTSIAIPVPSGAAAGDIVVCFVGQFDHFGAAITAPTGFTQFAQIALSTVRVTGFWKRLSASDTGSYTFSWSSSSTWANGNALCITGALAVGDPIEDFVTGSATGTAYPDLTVTTVTAPFLGWGGYNENADTTHDVPDSYTGIAAQDYGMTAYRVPATTGTHTATGATAGVSTNLVVILAAIAAEDGGTPIGKTAETDTARPLTRSKTAGLAATAEADTARNVGRLKTTALAAPAETDTARGLAGSKTVGLGATTETDTARPVGRIKTRPLGRALDTSTARSLTRSKTAGLGRGAETDIARPLGATGAVVLGRAAETDLARGLGRAKTRQLGRATETSLARAVEAVRVVALGRALETDTATALRRAKTLLLGRGVETDTARAVTNLATLAGWPTAAGAPTVATPVTAGPPTVTYGAGAGPPTVHQAVSAGEPTVS
jgi:hypothetical protein